MQTEKVIAHNPTYKEITCEKRDIKQAKAEMRGNVARVEHRAEKKR